MRSLAFNLLNDYATLAGCADEAWEIITEFAAAESLLASDTALAGRSRGDTSLQSQLLMGTEALLSCLGVEAVEPTIESDNGEQSGQPACN